MKRFQFQKRDKHDEPIRAMFVLTENTLRRRSFPLMNELLSMRLHEEKRVVGDAETGDYFDCMRVA